MRQLLPSACLLLISCQPPSQESVDRSGSKSSETTVEGAELNAAANDASNVNFISTGLFFLGHRSEASLRNADDLTGFNYDFVYGSYNFTNYPASNGLIVQSAARIEGPMYSVQGSFQETARAICSPGRVATVDAVRKLPLAGPRSSNRYVVLADAAGHADVYVPKDLRKMPVRDDLSPEIRKYIGRGYVEGVLFLSLTAETNNTSIACFGTPKPVAGCPFRSNAARGCVAQDSVLLTADQHHGKWYTIGLEKTSGTVYIWSAGERGALLNKPGDFPVAQCQLQTSGGLPLTGNGNVAFGASNNISSNGDSYLYALQRGSSFVQAWPLEDCMTKDIIRPEVDAQLKNSRSEIVLNDSLSGFSGSPAGVFVAKQNIGPGQLRDLAFALSTRGVRLVFEDIAPARRSDSLKPGESLSADPGQRNTLTSANGQYKVVLQVDGNLVVTRIADNVVLWHAASHGRGGVRITMQTDGNLVLYDRASTAIWHSQTHGAKGAANSRADMQDDGNLVIYGPDNKARWSWKTGLL